jgi:threonine dehydrogenase-like Zn-dependent dehydrogenase
MEAKLMKGIVYTAKGVTEIVDLPKPKCTDDTMLLQNIFSGISNGSERNILMQGNYWIGRWPDWLNYQPVARVVETGKNIKKYKIGDVLFVGGTFPGHMQYHLATEDESNLIVKIPDDFPLEQAALLGVMGVGYHANEYAGVAPQHNCLIIGGGVIGLATLQGAIAHGAKTTFAARYMPVIQFAKEELGADHAFNISTQEGRSGITANGPYDYVFDVAGAREIEELIVGPGWNLREGESKAKWVDNFSKVVWVAARDNVVYNFNEAEQRQMIFIHPTHFTLDNLHTMIRLAKKGVLKIDKMITRVVPLQDAVKVFNILRDNPRELRGTVIDWRDVPPEN